MQILRKTTGIALSLIGAIALGIKSADAIHVGVSPPRFEVNIDKKSRSETIKIVNLDKKPVVMKAFVRSWTINKDGDMQIVQSTEQTLDQWIIFTPSQFTIPAGSSQTVRFAIRPKVEPKPGEHRAVLYLQEVPSQASQTQDSNSVTTVGRLGIIIYGYAGEIKRVGALHSVNVDAKPNGINAVFDVSNTGNAHVRLNGEYAIWSAANYPGAKATQPLKKLNNSKDKPPQNILHTGNLKLNPVLSDTRRQLVLPITKKLPPGNYVLDINGELSGVPIDKGIPFTVPATANVPKPAKTPVTSLSK